MFSIIFCFPLSILCISSLCKMWIFWFFNGVVRTGDEGVLIVLAIGFNLGLWHDVPTIEFIFYIHTFLSLISTFLVYVNCWGIIIMILQKSDNNPVNKKTLICWIYCRSPPSFCFFGFFSLWIFFPHLGESNTSFEKLASGNRNSYSLRSSTTQSPF